MSKKKPKPIPRDSIKVNNSVIHGKGVFALSDIKRGECIIEYQGERISWKKALARHPHDLNQPNHTFYFALSDGRVIDGNVKGNAARWINHSCMPNCATLEFTDKKDKLFVFVMAKKNIRLGQELFYDYGLEVEGKRTKAQKNDYACHCGTKKCRGNMLSKK